MTRPVVEFIKKQFCVSDPCINGRYVTSRLVTSASVSLSLSPSIKSAVCVTSRLQIKLLAPFHRSDSELTFETSDLKLFTVANLRYRHS